MIVFLTYKENSYWEFLISKYNFVIKVELRTKFVMLAWYIFFNIKLLVDIW